MKAKELSDKLMKYPDFDVEVTVCLPPAFEGGWPIYEVFTDVEFGDIGYSDKVVQIVAYVDEE